MVLRNEEDTPQSPNLGGIVSTVFAGSCQKMLGLFTEEAKDLGRFVKNGMGIPNGPVEGLMMKEESGIDRVKTCRKICMPPKEC